MGNAYRTVGGILAGCVIAAALAFLLASSAESNTSNDFSFYWTAAKLVQAGKNPYSSTDSLDLQRRLRFAGKGELVMRNPPWIIPVIAPFGYLSLSFARAFWLLIALILTATSVHWLWEFYGPGANEWVGWLVAFVYLPLAVALAIGQIGPLILFGLAGFLRAQAKGNELASGMFLFLAALKPHIIFLLWLALALTAFHDRRWKAVTAFFAVLSVASSVAILLDHRAFMQFIKLFAEQKVLLEETPTLGGLLRHISGFRWMQFLPVVLATFWFAFYWTRWRSEWDWGKRLPSLLLASLTASSYTWFFDQIVLLPAVFYATVLVLRMRPSLQLTAVIIYLFLNCYVVILLLHHRITFSYAWTALAWLIFYAIVHAAGVSTKQKEV